ncbi:MAG TPA: cellulase family glycosylhydrolase [Phenylobacterium sp.]|nr:cellulase family glycosylhydrolase [Phenylobacterium sp.]
MSVAASQIVDQSGQPVRLDCIAWWPGYANPNQMMLTIVAAGFNCVRISYFNATLSSDLAAIDQAVQQAAAVSVRVIINNHANEGEGNCNSQQANGLPFDSGPGTNNTDGCGATGTVTATKWVSDWVRVATRYKGNDAVSGYDLWNEPLEIPGGSTWGDGSVSDLRALYQQAGNAIQAVDSDKLIICEGPILWAPLYQADLSHVASAPVVLNRPNKVVYSVHEYPSDIGGEPNDSGDAYVQQMNQAFGYLITQNIAPVWVGELGASLDGTAGSNLADEQAWAATIVPYLNGTTPGGLKIPAGGQGLGTDWWALTSCPSNCGGPDGALESDMTTLKQQQAAIYSQFVQAPLAGASRSGATSASFSAQTAIVSATAFPASTVAAKDAQVTAAIQATLPAAPSTPTPTAAVPAAIGQTQTNGQMTGTDTALTSAAPGQTTSTASQSAATALQDIVTGDALARQAEAAVQTNAPAATSAALIKQAQAALQAALAAQGGN